MTEFHHLPVMRDEVVATFATVPPGVIVDATLGGGGHSAALLASRDDLSILGIDRDRAALAAATRHLADFDDRIDMYRGRFDEIPRAMTQAKIENLSGVLFDLGVSSPQLDTGQRGFSYRHDGPIDMRMDTDQALSAADIVNGYEESALAEVLRRFGDERYSRRIAAAVAAARPIETTSRLAALVAAAIPAPARRSGGHPAKRTFQAIRIAVNQELDILPESIDIAVEALTAGGRIAVLAYHSGEDRIVKARLRAAATGGCQCPDGLPCVCGAIKTVKIVRGIPKRPSSSERATNRRAASARYRVAEKL